MERALHKVLDEYGAAIEKEIANYFKDKHRDASYHEFIAHVYRSLEDYVLRKGTRLASCCTLLIYKGYKNGVDDAIAKVCAGIELYRHAILIHDDLVDRDELRRGEASFHKLFGVLPERFGDSVGMFAGNILYSLAVDCILKSRFEQGLLRESIMVLNREYGNVNESQMLDVLFEYHEPDETEWYQMASKRAASLFQAAMLIGAMLSNAPESEKEILRNLAEHMGYALDIRDDIIGTFATREEYGREPLGDITLFKKPLQLIYTLTYAEQGVVHDMRAMLKSGDIEGVKAIIREYGLARAKDTAREHAAHAITLIDQTAMQDEVKQFFRALLSYSSESLDSY